MSCRCYEAGGPFIGADPDCPLHGSEVKARDQEMADLRATVGALREQIEELAIQIQTLRKEIRKS